MHHLHHILSFRGISVSAELVKVDCTFVASSHNIIRAAAGPRGRCSNRQSPKQNIIHNHVCDEHNERTLVGMLLPTKWLYIRRV